MGSRYRGAGWTGAVTPEVCELGLQYESASFHVPPVHPWLQGFRKAVREFFVWAKTPVATIKSKVHRMRSDWQAILVGVLAWLLVAVFALFAVANWDPFWGFFPVLAAVLVAWAVGEWVTRREAKDRS
jgi:uncharacterized integral membrane protein